jgi:hypothetical protein
MGLDVVESKYLSLPYRESSPVAIATGEQRKFWNEELHNLYSSYILRTIKPRMIRTCSKNGWEEVRKKLQREDMKEREPLERPRHKWQGKMDLKKYDRRV